MDEDFNPMANFEEFVNEEEVEIVNEEEQEEYEIEEELEPIKIPIVKPTKKLDEEEEIQPKKQLSKQEYALVQEKRKNKDIMKMFESLTNEVKQLKESEFERSTTNRRKKLINEYVEDGYDENIAAKMAEKDLKLDNVTTEIGSMKKMIDELLNGKQSTFDTKTQAEQEVLYKQSKGIKSKSDSISNTVTTQTVKATQDDLRVFNLMKKRFPDMTLKSFKESGY